MRGHLPLRIGLTLALKAGIVWALTHRQLFGADTIESAISQPGVWAPVKFLVLYAAGTILFFSGGLLSLAGGALFGPVGAHLEPVGRPAGRHVRFPYRAHDWRRLDGATSWRSPAAGY